MTAYTLAANATLRDIGNAAIWGVATARSGGDTIDTNGFTFTQDQDNRYGLSGASTYTWGNVTINATKGGKWVIDATKVWMIPFTSGSGTITLGGFFDNINGANYYVIGIYTALNAAPAATGASGWVKIVSTDAAASNAPGMSGTSTKAGFTATWGGMAIRGFIEVNGDEGAGVIANRLGSFEMKGAWFEVGTTSGGAPTTYQLPTNGSVQYYPAVWVDSDSVTITGASWANNAITYTCASHTFVVGDEVTVTGASPSAYNVTDQVITAVTETSFTVAGSDPGTWTSGGSAKVMEAYPCAGSLLAASSTATDFIRGKVCWASTAGVLRFGSDGTNTVGYIPPSGRRIRIPNILTANNTTAARGTNALPNATLATRYDFTTTGGGVISINKAYLNWYPSFSQAYSVNLKYAAIAEQLSVSEVAAPMTITRCAVGQSAAQAQFGLLMSLCFAGGTFNGNVWTSATLGASGRYIASLTDIAGFTFNRNKEYSFVLRANATTGAATLTRVQNSTWNNHVMGSGQHLLTTCKNLTYNNTAYFDCITTTGTANPMSVWAAASNCDTLTFNGLSWAANLLNIQPYTAILSVNAAGCTNIKLRNIGTYVSPLNLGTVNATGLIFALAAASAASDIKVQRVYVSNTRTGQFTADNSSTRVLLENVFGDYVDGSDVSAALNLTQKGLGTTKALTAQTAVYGTHWVDYHLSNSASKISILMNESTSLTSAYIYLQQGAAFTSAGGLYMPSSGVAQMAQFETPYYIIGHTGFANTALVMAGGTATNYGYDYAIDKNDGTGYSAMTSAQYSATNLGTALSQITGIDAQKGFKLKLRIWTLTANTAAITSISLTTTSTATSQAYQYPLDTNTVTFTGVPAGTDMVVLSAGTTTILQQNDATSTFSYTYSGTPAVDVGFIKPGYVPFYIRNLSLGSTDSSIPVSLTPDRNYA